MKFNHFWEKCRNVAFACLSGFCESRGVGESMGHHSSGRTPWPYDPRTSNPFYRFDLQKPDYRSAARRRFPVDVVFLVDWLSPGSASLEVPSLFRRHGQLPCVSKWFARSSSTDSKPCKLKFQTHIKHPRLYKFFNPIPFLTQSRLCWI